MHYTTPMPPRRSKVSGPRASGGNPSDAGDNSLLTRVGRSVREARRGKGLTRSGLAALSGVSERFIARIESGTGNVSLVRLNDLARALAVPLVSLVAAAPAAGGPRVALVGLRGAGRSTLGPPLAPAPGVPFGELDP